MKIIEEKIDRISASNSNGVVWMLVEGLCGAKYSNLFANKGKSWLLSLPQALEIELKDETDAVSKLNELSKPDAKRPLGPVLFETFYQEESKLIKEFVTSLTKNSLDMAQLNEILLLLDQDRVEEGFFDYFFRSKFSGNSCDSKSKQITFEELKEGIKKFRATAMLCFGNIRFSYKELRKKNYFDIDKRLKEICNLPAIKGALPPRPKSRVLEVTSIDKEKTWFVGYISQKILKKEKAKINTEKEEIQNFYRTMEENYKKTNQRAEENTEIYLSWDYMDVYIATSMRQRWEFEDTFEFIEKLFSHKNLKDLNLRYFDPTQSGTGERRIDKGLIEGLMLKRAVCTIYLAQESDTMGKDSELAATLAQGKPVIAFVPEFKPDNLKEKFKTRPLEFFKTRYRMLQADGLFEDENFSKHCEVKGYKANDIEEKLEKFVQKIKNHRKKNYFSLWHEEHEDKNFKSDSSNEFQSICEWLAFSESYYFDKRYYTLAKTHPLSLQVHLDTGVSNGVLVVRNVDQCSQLLRSIFGGEMSFSIERNSKERVTELKETITNCPFRAVTESEQLTNSFWNFYPS